VSQKKQDTGVRVKEGVEKKARNQAVGSAVHPHKHGSKESQRNEGGAMEMDGTKGEG
jgi:hypothetical protein